jgi:membrane protein YdbS with pleckstrin-like domain
MFENDQIDDSELPKIEELSYTKIKKGYLWMSLLVWVLYATPVPIILTIIANKSEEFPKDLQLYLTLGWSALMLFILIETILSYFRKGYALRNHDISFRKGWFFRSLLSIPFNRVQHCEVKQGPIESLFGMASLKVYTAGGGGSDMKIPGLSPEKAKSLRSHITNIVSDITED